jgi:hypothetical protein
MQNKTGAFQIVVARNFRELLRSYTNCSSLLSINSMPLWGNKSQRDYLFIEYYHCIQEAPGGATFCKWYFDATIWVAPDKMIVN